jgi:ribose transport system ATP-binding protein
MINESLQRADKPLSEPHVNAFARSARSAGESTPALTLTGVSKSFPGTRALHDVSLAVAPGEIHALMGPNGSGKSTLIKILAGFHGPESGDARLAGKSFPLGDAHSAHVAGIRFVHQDLGLVGALDTVDNLALGFGYATGFGFRVRWPYQADRARTAIAALGHQFDVTRPIDHLTISDRTAVAIARALQDWEGKISLLVLDEPTAAMPLPEIERFLATVRRVAARGTAVLYVSHHLGEVFDLADRMTVLRDGQLLGTFDVASMTKARVVELMTGAAVVEGKQVPRAPHGRQQVLDVRGLAGRTLQHLDLSLNVGEIVGVAGISGSGRDEVCDLIFGGLARKGEIAVAGSRLEPSRPDRSVARGIGLVPANRHRDGVITSFSVRENITLPDLTRFWRRLWMRRRPEVDETGQWISSLRIKTPSTETAVSSLSGGNQQKVVLGKWLRQKPRVLLLDEPTQGVDVGATAEIHQLISNAAVEGAAVLICSSDEEELAQLCDRVVVLREGQVTEELVGPDVSAARITQESLGVGPGLPGSELAQGLLEPIHLDGST